MQLRLNQWSDLNIGIDPGTSLADVKTSTIATLLGSDYQGVKFQVLAEEGTRVLAGQAVMCDRRHSEIHFTAPVSGVVSRVQRGSRRSLVGLEITADGQQESIGFEIPNQFGRDNVRNLMQKTGLWTALKCRPFGYVPKPDAEPKALLVSAIDTQPLAPNPSPIIAQHSDAFSAGLRMLCDLVEAPVHLCQSSHADFEFDNSLGVKVNRFDGPHPAGLVGRHIHALSPIGFDGKRVWHIGYQDVISLGYLKTTGSPWYERLVSLAGSAVTNPRLIKVPLGANIADITAGELLEGPTQIFSGSILSGHLAKNHFTCLGRFHHQITAVSAELFDTQSNARAGSLIAIPDLDKVAPPGILAVPLLRALLVGDVERVLDLGALELVEEDLALLSYSCPTQSDYGALLRNMLDQIEREGLSIVER